MFYQNHIRRDKISVTMAISYNYIENKNFKNFTIQDNEQQRINQKTKNEFNAMIIKNR